MILANRLSQSVTKLPKSKQRFVSFPFGTFALEWHFWQPLITSVVFASSDNVLLGSMVVLQCTKCKTQELDIHHSICTGHCPKIDKNKKKVGTLQIELTGLRRRQMTMAQLLRRLLYELIDRIRKGAM